MREARKAQKNIIIHPNIYNRQKAKEKVVHIEISYCMSYIYYKLLYILFYATFQ